MDTEPDSSADRQEVTRDPTFDDIAGLCRELNARGAKYILVGGFAIVLHGYARHTADVDLLIEVGAANESKVIDALRLLPDHAADLLTPGEVDTYGVVRVGDEIMVDLMKSGCGVTYADAIRDAMVKDIQGVPVPVASPQTMWRMKQTLREKDIPDRLFLRQWAEVNNITLEPLPTGNATIGETWPDWVPLPLRRLLRWLFAPRSR